MTTPSRNTASSRLIVISYNGRCRRFDLDGDGRLSFAHIARVFRIPLNEPDECDNWTLDDTSLRIDKSDPGALLTVSALRDLFPLPGGTTEQPLMLRTEDAEAPAAPPMQQPVQARKATPRRGDNNQRAAVGHSASPLTRAAAAAGMVTPRPRHATAAEALPPRPDCQTPGAASPLRGARTPLGPVLVPAVSQGLSVSQSDAGAMELVRRTTGNEGLFRHPRSQGTFYFSTAAAQHLPMLMACHLPPPLQRLLRHFSVAAQCAITARAMALYTRTSDAEFFRDQRLEAAVSEARSRKPPQDRYCAYTLQAARLTGRKRKPGVSPHPNATTLTPLTSRGAGTTAVTPPPQQPSCTDVDMDAGSWSFIGGGTLHCPGGAACRKNGRHENWLLSEGSENSRMTYLPVLYDDEEHSAVLLPLSDPRVNGGDGRPPPAEQPTLWFRYEYESRGGRRGNNFWDRGLQEHLEQAVRDVAGEEGLRSARGA